MSCKKENSEKESIEVKLHEFSAVTLNSTFDVFLIQDTLYSVKIVADESFINDVVYNVSDTTLFLSVNSGSLWLKPKKNKISVYISCDSLKFLKANETCMIRTVNPIVSSEFGMVLNGKLNEANLDLAGDVFYYWNVHPCGGKIVLNGNINYLKLWNVGLMEVDAINLMTVQALVDNKSKAPVRVNVTGRLEYKISGEGNIYLKGNPSEIIEEEVTSSGRLVTVN